MSGADVIIGDAHVTECDPRLRVDLQMHFPDHCPLNDPPDDVVDTRVQYFKNSCQIDFVLSCTGSDTGPRVCQRKVDFPEMRSCDCVFQDFHTTECVPHVIDVTTRPITIATYVPDREKVRDLVSKIRSRGSPVQLLNLSATNPPQSEPNIAEVDLASLTDKQREAIEVAQEMGYYGSGNGVTLHDMADELGITASAMSQRLTRAEEEIFVQLFRY